MKLVMALGGLIGFGIGLGFSWAQGSPWPSAVWRAAATCLAAGLLLRWWGRLWVRCLQDAHLDRQRVALAAAKPRGTQTPLTSTPAKK